MSEDPLTRRELCRTVPLTALGLLGTMGTAHAGSVEGTTVTTSGPGTAASSRSTGTPFEQVAKLTTDGLRDAVGDWSTGAISTTLLQRVVAAWASGDPVE